MQFIPWWDRWPGRLEAELQAFARRGWDFRVDPTERAADRIVVSGVAPISSDEETELVVVYPDTFPNTRVAIYAPQLTLKRHQNPLETDLCVLPSGSDYWRPSILAAQLVEEQVPEVVRLARSSDPAESATEYPQGEPFTVYYPYLPTGGFLIPQELFELPPAARHGEFEVVLDPDEMWLTEALGDNVDLQLLGHGAVTRLETPTEVLVDSSRIARGFTGPTWKGRWTWVPEAPATSDVGEIIAAAAKTDPTIAQRNWFHAGGAGERFDLIGLAFPEEVRQDVWETGWIFLVVRRETKHTLRGWIIRGLRYSREHLVERIHELSLLQQKTVSVAGLGTLGAPICFQLAAALTGTVRPLDPDFFDPATSVRWPAGVRAAGAQKAAYIKDELESQYPLTEVERFDLTIGSAPMRAEIRERDVLLQWLEGTDLVIDATAESNVSRAIAYLAHEAGIPQIFVWSIDGYGGVVACLRKGRTGCYLCLDEALSAGEIEPPPAATDERPRIQPRGCGSPTFVAPYVDLMPLSVEASRLAFAELTAGEGGYPSADFDALTFAIRNPDGTLRSPTWTAWRLPPRPGCPLCEAST